MVPELEVIGARRIAVGSLTLVLILTAYVLLGPTAGAKLSLVLAFAVSVMNIVFSERTAGEVSAVDLSFLLVAGFAASAHGAASLSEEIAFALLRMTLLGAAVSGLAWLYEQWRGASGLGHSDIVLIAILAAFMPLAVAIYAVAFAITLTITVIAALHLYRGEPTTGQSQLPIASSLSVLYFCVWVAYRLNAEGNL